MAKVGMVLGRTWRLDEPLGEGGLATVFRATHVTTGERVAVKVLHADLSRDPEIRARFAREAYAANRIAHPGAVRVLADGSEGDESYLVMELVSGRSLKQLFRERGRRLPIAELAPIVTELLDVLAAAHELGIVHRDIKPDNVLVASDGRVKLVDFGIARVRGDSAAKTATGVVLGTPTFMAPEQARGKWSEVDGRTDLFALAATIYTALSGAFVHEGTTVPELVISAATRQVPSLATVIEGVSPSIVHVVDRALSFDRDDRFPDARTMRTAWLDALAGRRVPPPDRRGKGSVAASLRPPAAEMTNAPVGASIGAAHPPASKESRRSVVLIASITGVIAAAAGFGAAALWLGGRARPKEARRATAASMPPPAPTNAPAPSGPAPGSSSEKKRCPPSESLQQFVPLLEASIGAGHRYMQLQWSPGYASALVAGEASATTYWLEPARCEISGTVPFAIPNQAATFTVAEIPWGNLERIGREDGPVRYQRETGHKGKLTSTLVSKMAGRLMFTLGVDGPGGSRTYLFERTGEPWTTW